MTAPRHVGLDAARAAVVLILVASHAALSFLVTPIGWAIQDDSRFLGVDLWVWIARGFEMPVFFWLSGFFARQVLVGRGAAGFVRHRATRVLVPLVLAIVPCSLALDALWDRGRAVAGRPEVAANLPKLSGSQLPLTLGHLWYLYYLLVISAIALAIAGLARRARIARPRGPGIIGVAAVLSLAPLAWAGVLELDTPLGFRVDPAWTAHCGAFFAWGWLVHGAPEQLARYAAHAWRLLAAAALLLVAVLPALSDDAVQIAAHRAPLYAIAASAGLSLALVAGILGLAVRYARRPYPVLALASRASYWLYITHLPLVVLLQIALARLAWPGPLKYLAIVAVTMTACLGSYAAFTGIYDRLRASTSRTSPPSDSPIGRPIGK